ncbi:MAG TPA: TRAP transporter small permease [bacterium]|nr:TRAP transporter small permease [bacterium]
MKTINKAIEGLSTILYYIAGAAIFFMMLITVADVIMRRFRYPLLGAYELVSFFGAISITFALSYTTLQKGHISVNLLTRLLPDISQKLIAILTNILSLIFLYYLANQLFLYAGRLATKGEVSLTLKLPYYYFIYAMSIGVYCVCIVEIIDSLKNIYGIVKKNDAF